jgi:hypothetical protein
MKKYRTGENPSPVRPAQSLALSVIPEMLLGNRRCENGCQGNHFFCSEFAIEPSPSAFATRMEYHGPRVAPAVPEPKQQ